LPVDDEAPRRRSKDPVCQGEAKHVRASEPGQSALLLLDAVDVLIREGIDYAVVGAMAASMYGVVRASADADAVLSLVSNQARKLQHVFQEAGFNAELQVGDFEDPIPALLQITDSFDNRVDLLVGLRGLEEEAFARAVDVRFEGADLRVISQEDFIAMKCFAGGPQDLADAANAVAVAESIDVDLVRRLAKRFGREAVSNLERVLREKE
jgi:predicted nucleotidyltransferase